MKNQTKLSLAYLTYVILSSAILGASLMGLINWIADQDFAATLANMLMLGNGVVAAFVLSGLVGGWLFFGKAKRIAWFTGAVCGIGVAALLWFVGPNYRWFIDLILTSAFGPNGKTFTALIMVMIFFGVIRMVSDHTAFAVEALIRRIGNASPDTTKTLERTKPQPTEKVTTNESAASL